MSKIYKFREWLTVPEAAKYMSLSLSEEVAEADVLRLALDGHLRLSVCFVNHADARYGTIVPWEETDWQLIPLHGVKHWWGPPPLDDSSTISRCVEEVIQHCITEYLAPDGPSPRKLVELYAEIPSDEHKMFLPRQCSVDIGGGRFFTPSNDGREWLNGVWDLFMNESAKIAVERRFQHLTGGPDVSLLSLNGGIFVIGTDGAMFQLLKSSVERMGRAEFHPTFCLPDDALLVVRTEAIREFERSISDQQYSPEKPLTTIERNSLLTIIAVLCGHSGIDIGERGTAAQLARITEEAGTPVSYDTVRRALARIPEALESRTK